MRQRDPILSGYSIFPPHLKMTKQQSADYLETLEKHDRVETRAVASFLAMAVGDALGAPFEFKVCSLNQLNIATSFPR